MSSSEAPTEQSQSSTFAVHSHFTFLYHALVNCGLQKALFDHSLIATHVFHTGDGLLHLKLLSLYFSFMQTLQKSFISLNQI
jgi:hypothetical protein